MQTVEAMSSDSVAQALSYLVLKCASQRTEREKLMSQIRELSSSQESILQQYRDASQHCESLQQMNAALREHLAMVEPGQTLWHATASLAQQTQLPHITAEGQLYTTSEPRLVEPRLLERAWDGSDRTQSYETMQAQQPFTPIVLSAQPPVPTIRTSLKSPINLKRQAAEEADPPRKLKKARKLAVDTALASKST